MLENKGVRTHPGSDIVRRFGDERRQSQPGDTMVRGLVTRTVIENWREDKLATLQSQWNMFLLEGRELALHLTLDDDEAFLLDQGRQLHAAWKRFCKSLPDDEQKSLYEELPSIRYLHESVTKASETWQEQQNSKGGRLKKIFTSLCNTLDTHSNLVSIIPTDDKYVRLLTGSLSAITQATVNHRKLADGVADSLEELSEDMGYWNELITDYCKDVKMHRHMIQIYVVVFEFLTEVFLQWSKSSWKRFVTSFDQNAFKKLFEEKRKRIKAIEGYMQRRASLISSRQVKHDQDDLRARQTRMESQMQKFWQDPNQSASHELSHPFHIELLHRLGTDTHNLLLQYITSSQHSIRPSYSIESPLDPSSSSQISQSSPSIKAVEEISALAKLDPALDLGPKYEGQNARRDIENTWESVSDVLGPILRKFGQDIENLVEITSQALKIKVGHLLRGRIETWTTNIESDQLWIQNGHETSHPSQSTLIAACLAALSNENDIPCVSYFCSLQIHNAYETVPSRRRMLLDMVKSLTAQLLLIYKSTQLKVDISFLSFKQLINPELDLKTALNLLREARSMLPSLTHFLIEGVQELENRSDMQQTRDFQEVLQAVIDLNQMPAPVPAGSFDCEREGSVTTELGHQSFSRQIKVCFASDGYVDALAQLVEAGQLEMISDENEGDQLGHDDNGELLAGDDYEGE